MNLECSGPMQRTMCTFLLEKFKKNNFDWLIEQAADQYGLLGLKRRYDLDPHVSFTILDRVVKGSACT